MHILMSLKCICDAIIVCYLTNVLTNLPFASSTLQTAKQWKTLNYNFLPQHSIEDSNFYNANNVLITGLAVSNDRIFVATPKLFSGVPSTVNVISKAQFGDSPVLQVRL